MTLTRTQVLDLLDRHGLAPSRAMGQNFVVDPNTIDAMVRAAELAPEDSVVEIGPGLGSLTRALAAEVDHVLAVEADRHLLAPLAEVADAPNIEIVHADATPRRGAPSSGKKASGGLWWPTCPTTSPSPCC